MHGGWGQDGWGPRWLGAAARQCRVWEVTWTAWDESAWSRVLQDVTTAEEIRPIMEQPALYYGPWVPDACAGLKECYKGQSDKGMCQGVSCADRG